MKCGKKELQLYAITDIHWLNGRSLYEVVKESLDGGVTFLQLREKQLDEDHFLEEAKKLQGLCSEYNAPFIINDNVEIADRTICTLRASSAFSSFTERIISSPTTVVPYSLKIISSISYAPLSR